MSKIGKINISIPEKVKVVIGPTNFNKGWDWSSSYHHTDSIVKGFCHINVSGTGMSDLGELTIMPATGKLKTGAGTQNNHMAGYSSLYRKNKEFVSPGYYKVFLERYGIDVELTATERVGLHKYTFPKSDKSRVIIDLGEGSADRPTETYIKKINDNETSLCATAERKMLQTIGGDCDTALGGLAEIENHNLKLKGQLFSDSGQDSFEYELTGREIDASFIGKSVGEKLLDLAGEKFKKK